MLSFKTSISESFNVDAISSLIFFKSMWEGNLYFGPLDTM